MKEPNTGNASVTTPRACPAWAKCMRCGGRYVGAYDSEVSCLQCGDVPQAAYAAALREFLFV